MSQQPYIGLRPFERNETTIFFGRQQHSDELIQRLGVNHFLAVIGTSGCGKSSLVKTGLMAGLEAGYLAKAGTHWVIAEMRPGTQPFQVLADTLFPALRRVLPRSFDARILEKKLREGSLSLHELLTRYPLPHQAQLLLVCDQFEEIFRFKNQTIPAETRNFVSLLLASSKPYPVSDTVVSHSIYVVLTMRSDFLGDCSQFRGLAEAINQGLYLTPRLDAEQLREAIEEPALMFGGEVEPALVTQLLEDAQHNQDQLPLLQHLLMRLWDLASANIRVGKRITLEAYEKAGGLSSYRHRDGKISLNALSRHANQVFLELKTPAKKRIAALMFRALTQRVDNQRDTRRPTKVAEIMALSAASLAEVTVVIDAFRQHGRCFLMPPHNRIINPETVIDISHESFIRQWDALQNWVIDEADSAAQYRRLEEAALRYERGEVGLLKNPELSNILGWNKKFKPTAQWAQRYAKGKNYFNKTLAYLTKSKNTNNLIHLLVILAIGLFLGLSYFIYEQKQEKEKMMQSAGMIGNRYQILANGLEVKDLQTNLIWQRCEVGKAWNGSTCWGGGKYFTFDDAQKQAGNGWRVPTMDELKTLLTKENVNSRYIHPEVFPNTASYVWSGSPYAYGASGAWYVYFGYGYSDGYDRSSNYGVRLVRGGQ